MERSVRANFPTLLWFCLCHDDVIPLLNNPPPPSFIHSIGTVCSFLMLFVSLTQATPLLFQTLVFTSHNFFFVMFPFEFEWQEALRLRRITCNNESEESRAGLDNYLDVGPVIVFPPSFSFYKTHLSSSSSLHFSPATFQCFGQCNVWNDRKITNYCMERIGWLFYTSLCVSHCLSSFC